MQEKKVAETKDANYMSGADIKKVNDNVANNNTGKIKNPLRASREAIKEDSRIGANQFINSDLYRVQRTLIENKKLYKYLQEEYVPNIYTLRDIPEEFGQSKYDKKIETMQDLQSLDDFRAKQQSGFAKAGNAIAKTFITYGTTTLQSTVGLLRGFVNGFSGEEDKTFMHNFLNNPWSRAFADAQNWGEETFPNYRTDEEREMPWWERSYKYTANFLFDDIIKNVGFSIGALRGGQLASLGLGAIPKATNWARRKLNKNLAKESTKIGLFSTKNGLKAERAAKEVKAAIANGRTEDAIAAMHKYSKAKTWGVSLKDIFVGGVLSGASEASIEALNQYDEFIEENSNLINNYIASNENVFRLDFISDNRNNKDLVRNGQLTEVGELMFQQSLQGRKDQAFAEMHKNAERMSNLNFMLQAPMLALTNMVGFSSFFAGGYKTSRIALNSMEAQSKNIFKRTKNILSKDGMQKRIGFQDGKAVVKKRKFADVARVVKAPISEGMQEMTQALIAESTEQYYGAKFNEATGIMLNEEYNEEAISLIKSFWEGFKGSFGDSETWLEGVAGFLMGAFGIPKFNAKMFKKAQAKEGKKLNFFEKAKQHMPFTFQGGIMEEVRQIGDEKRSAQDIIGRINSKIESGDIKNMYRNLTLSLAYNQQKNEAASVDDKMAFHDKNNLALTSIVALFNSAGLSEELLEMVDAALDITEEEAAVIKKSFLIDENGESATKKTAAEISENVKKHAKKIKEQIIEYSKIYEDTKAAFGDVFDENAIRDFSARLSLADNKRRRIREMLFEDNVDEALEKSVSKKMKEDKVLIYNEDSVIDFLENDIANKKEISNNTERATGEQAEFIEEIYGEDLNILKKIITEIKREFTNKDDLQNIDTVDKIIDIYLNKKSKDKLLDTYYKYISNPEEYYNQRKKDILDAAKNFHEAQYENFKKKLSETKTIEELETLLEDSPDKSIEELIDDFKNEKEIKNKLLRILLKRKLVAEIKKLEDVGVDTSTIEKYIKKIEDAASLEDLNRVVKDIAALSLTDKAYDGAANEMEKILIQEKFKNIFSGLSHKKTETKKQQKEEDSPKIKTIKAKMRSAIINVFKELKKHLEGESSERLLKYIFEKNSEKDTNNISLSKIRAFEMVITKEYKSAPDKKEAPETIIIIEVDYEHGETRIYRTDSDAKNKKSVSDSISTKVLNNEDLSEFDLVRTIPDVFLETLPEVLTNTLRDDFGVSEDLMEEALLKILGKTTFFNKTNNAGNPNPVNPWIVAESLPAEHPLAIAVKEYKELKKLLDENKELQKISDSEKKNVGSSVTETKAEAKTEQPQQTNSEKQEIDLSPFEEQKEMALKELSEKRKALREKLEKGEIDSDELEDENNKINEWYENTIHEIDNEIEQQRRNPEILNKEEKTLNRAFSITEYDINESKSPNHRLVKFNTHGKAKEIQEELIKFGAYDFVNSGKLYEMYQKNENLQIVFLEKNGVIYMAVETGVIDNGSHQLQVVGFVNELNTLLINKIRNGKSKTMEDGLILYDFSTTIAMFAAGDQVKDESNPTGLNEFTNVKIGYSKIVGGEVVLITNDSDVNEKTIMFPPGGLDIGSTYLFINNGMGKYIPVKTMEKPLYVFINSNNDEFTFIDRFRNNPIGKNIEDAITQLATFLSKEEALSPEDSEHADYLISVLNDLLVFGKKSEFNRFKIRIDSSGNRFIEVVDNELNPIKLGEKQKEIFNKLFPKKSGKLFEHILENVFKSNSGTSRIIIDKNDIEENAKKIRALLALVSPLVKTSAKTKEEFQDVIDLGLQETTVLRNTVVNAGFVVKFDVGSKEEGSMESNTIKDDTIHVSLSRVNMKMGKPGKIHFKRDGNRYIIEGAQINTIKDNEQTSTFEDITTLQEIDELIYNALKEEDENGNLTRYYNDITTQEETGVDGVDNFKTKTTNVYYFNFRYNGRDFSYKKTIVKKTVGKKTIISKPKVERIDFIKPQKIKSKPIQEKSEKTESNDSQIKQEKTIIPTKEKSIYDKVVDVFNKVQNKPGKDSKKIGDVLLSLSRLGLIKQREMGNLVNAAEENGISFDDFKKIFTKDFVATLNSENSTDRINRSIMCR